MSSICEFCAFTSALALRWISLTPSDLAWLVIESVSVDRKGLLVDSDCEKPTTVPGSVRLSCGTPPP